MADEFSGLSNAERLHAENEFLQLKLIAEFGASPGAGDFGDTGSPELTNIFLKQVLEFEQHHATVKEVPLGEVHNMASLFPPLYSIPEEKVQEAWDKMLAFLQANWINVNAISPRVTPAELYRFVMEELVHEPVPSVPLRGMTVNFIYDEFHPDREYDACCRAQDDCILPLFGVYPLVTRYYIRGDGVWLNQVQLADGNDYTRKVKEFQSRFDQMILQESIIRSCEMGKNNCIVKGNYVVLVEHSGESTIHRGEWLVTLYNASDDNYWEIGGVSIDMNI